MVLVVYVATHRTPGLENYRNSLDKLGWPHQHLAMGETWGGWRYRMAKYLDFCRTRPPSEILILTDADDVLVVRPFIEHEVINLYQSYGKPLVVTLESGCYNNNCQPIDGFWRTSKTLQAMTKLKYVNAGTLMGTAAALVDLWEWELAQPYGDDQVALGHYMNTFPDRVAADIFSGFAFCHISPVKYDPLQIEWQSTSDGVPWIATMYDHVNHRSMSPMFLHFPGNFMATGITALLFGTVRVMEYNDVAQTILADDAMPGRQWNAAMFCGPLFWFCLILLSGLILMIVIVVIKHRRLRKASLELERLSTRSVR